MIGTIGRALLLVGIVGSLFGAIAAFSAARAKQTNNPNESVARLVPLLTQRGVAAATPAVADRLRRTVVEACKQCGRNTLMDVAAPLAPEALVTALPTDAVVILAMPGAPPLSADPVARARRLVGVIGPEGGFTLEEVARLEQWGARRTGLAPHVLRVETAAIALAAALQAVAPAS